MLKSHTDLKEKVRTIYPLIQGKALTDVADVAELVTREGLKDGAMPATINRKLAALRRVANLAYRKWGWLEKPLGERIHMLPGEKQRSVFINPAEVAKLARKAPSKPVRDAILLAAMSGLRRGEILSLTPSCRRDGAFVLSDTKSGRPRIVPLPPEALTIKLPLGISKHVLKHGFDDARKAAKLEHVRFHDLRRCYGTWLMQGGANLAAIRDLLGHSNISVTSRYLAASSSDLAAAVKLLPRIPTEPTRGRGKRKKVA